jgi:hypothetical protein
MVLDAYSFNIVKIRLATHPNKTKHKAPKKTWRQGAFIESPSKIACLSGCLTCEDESA